jgi:hypothetical protein
VIDMPKTEVWLDFIGLAHASVPLTSNAVYDATIARKAVLDAYGPLAASRLRFERVTLHGTAIYSEMMED